jgi:hypothetical protein
MKSVFELIKSQLAYLLVHSLAVASYLARFVLYSLPIYGTNGSSGFGSVKSEQIESNTPEIFNVGDQFFLNIST